MIGTKINFQFLPNTFLDGNLENDPLIYKLKVYLNEKELKIDWLNFSSQERLIYGTANKENIGHYKLEFIADDGYKNISSFIEFDISSTLELKIND